MRKLWQIQVSQIYRTYWGHFIHDKIMWTWNHSHLPVELKNLEFAVRKGQINFKKALFAIVLSSLFSKLVNFYQTTWFFFTSIHGKNLRFDYFFCRGSFPWKEKLDFLFISPFKRNIFCRPESIYNSSTAVYSNG